MAGCGCKDVSEKFANTGCPCTGNALPLPPFTGALAPAGGCGCKAGVATPAVRPRAIEPLPPPPPLPPLQAFEGIDLGKIGEAPSSGTRAIEALPPLASLQAIDLGKIGQAVQIGAPTTGALPPQRSAAPAPLSPAPSIRQLARLAAQHAGPATMARPAFTAAGAPQLTPVAAPRSSTVRRSQAESLPPLPMPLPLPVVGQIALAPIAAIGAPLQPLPNASRALAPLVAAGLFGGALGRTGGRQWPDGATPTAEDLSVVVCPQRSDVANGQPFEQVTVEVDGMDGPPVPGTVDQNGLVVLQGGNSAEWQAGNGVGIFHVAGETAVGFSTVITQVLPSVGGKASFLVATTSPMDGLTPLPTADLVGQTVSLCHDHFLAIQAALLANNGPDAPANRVVNLLAGNFVIGTPYAVTNRPLLLPSSVRVRGAGSGQTTISVAQHANQTLVRGGDPGTQMPVDPATIFYNKLSNCLFMNSQNKNLAGNQNKQGNNDVELSGMTLVGNRETQDRWWTGGGDASLWEELGASPDASWCAQSRWADPTSNGNAWVCVTVTDPKNPDRESTPTQPATVLISNDQKKQPLSGLRIELTGQFPPGVLLNLYLRPFLRDPNGRNDFLDPTDPQKKNDAAWGYYPQCEPTCRLLKKQFQPPPLKPAKPFDLAVPGLVRIIAEFVPDASPVDGPNRWKQANDPHIYFNDHDPTGQDVQANPPWPNTITGSVSRIVPPEQQFPKGLGGRSPAYGGGAGCALEFDQGSGLTLRDLVIRGFGWGGIDLGNSGNMSDVCADAVTIDDCFYSAVGLQAAPKMENVLFNACTFKNMQQAVDMEVGNGPILNNVVFQGCEFTNLSAAGFMLNFGDDTTVSGLRIVGCQFLYVCGTPIYFNCTVWDAKLQGYRPAQNSTFDGVLIDSSVFSDGLGTAILIAGPTPTPPGAKPPTIRNCLFWKNGKPPYAPPPAGGIPGYHRPFSDFSPAISFASGADGWIATCNLFHQTPQAPADERTLKPAIEAWGWGPVGHVVTTNGLESIQDAALVLVVGADPMAAPPSIDLSRFVYRNCSLAPDTGNPNVPWEWVSGPHGGPESQIQAFSGACMRGCPPAPQPPRPSPTVLGHLQPVYIYQPLVPLGDPGPWRPIEATGANVSAFIRTGQ